MTESLIDLRALLVEREDFEGGMVCKLREGLAQGGPQVRNLNDIIDTLNKRLAVAAAPQQKKIHLKLGVANYFLGHIRAAVEHLKKAEGPLAAFFLGQAHVALGQASSTPKANRDNTDHYDAALKAFEKAEKSGYAAQQVQLQRAGVLRLQGHIGEAKTILTKLKDAAAHNAEYHYQEGGARRGRGRRRRGPPSTTSGPSTRTAPRRRPVPPRLPQRPAGQRRRRHRLLRAVPEVPAGRQGRAVQPRRAVRGQRPCTTRPPTATAGCAKADPRDERAKLFVKDAEASLTMYYSPEDEQVSVAVPAGAGDPVTDFELSVRSRNCLKKMNIRTLGDLTRSPSRNCWRARTSARRRSTRSRA